MTVHINGMTFSGSNLSIVGGKIFVDGKEVEVKETKTKEIRVTVEGNIETLEVESGSVEIVGNVGNIEITSGNLKVTGDINGNAEITSGNIKVQGKIGGNASVSCGNIKRGEF